VVGADHLGTEIVLTYHPAVLTQFIYRVIATAEHEFLILHGQNPIKVVMEMQ
jgi:hypothetical protein